MEQEMSRCIFPQTDKVGRASNAITFKEQH